MSKFRHELSRDTHARAALIMLAMSFRTSIQLLHVSELHDVVCRADIG